jgi:hypothetical protein
MTQSEYLQATNRLLMLVQADQTAYLKRTIRNMSASVISGAHSRRKVEAPMDYVIILKE